jgi:putative ABC transport system permease protein
VTRSARSSSTRAARHPEPSPKSYAPRSAPLRPSQTSGSTRAVVGSRLTAVDLSGLTRVELGFAIVLVAAATGLALALGYIERRRMFAIATSLGATPRQLGGFVWSEAMFVTAGGLAVGALAGWALTAMLVKVLTGVFDPLPASLSVPWLYLAVVGAVWVAAVVAAGFATITEARRAPAARLREL